MSAFLERMATRALRGETELAPRIGSYFAGTGDAGPPPFDLADGEGEAPGLEAGPPAEPDDAAPRAELRPDPRSEPARATPPRELERRTGISRGGESGPGEPAAVTAGPVATQDLPSARREPQRRELRGDESEPGPARQAAPALPAQTDESRAQEAPRPQRARQAPAEPRLQPPSRRPPAVAIAKEEPPVEPAGRSDPRPDFTAAVARAILQPSPAIADRPLPDPVTPRGERAVGGPTISVHIGKVTVAAPQPGPTPAEAAAAASGPVAEWSPALSLEGYLAQRREGRR